MTVADLRDMLEDFEDDMEVCIGMQQNYGCNWAYSVCDPEEIDVKDFDGKKESYVVLTMVKQFGTVRYEEY